MSHGVSWAGSEVRRALYEAKIGNRIVIMELEFEEYQYLAFDKRMIGWDKRKCEGGV